MNTNDLSPDMAFKGLIEKAFSGEELNSDEKETLELAAKELGAYYEVNGDKKCYWICETSGFHCNPKFPPPNCKCIKRCI